MERSYLEFEKPIEEIKKQISQTLEIGDKGQVGIKETLKELEIKLSKITREIFDNLSPWQKVQLSRHPDRPYTLDYVNAITDGNFLELHGDRNVKDDKAMVGGFGEIDGKTYMIIGQQKGRNTKERKYRNFGMANPEGYRKALRLMKLAEKFNKPIIAIVSFLIISGLVISIIVTLVTMTSNDTETSTDSSLAFLVGNGVCDDVTNTNVLRPAAEYLLRYAT